MQSPPFNYLVKSPHDFEKLLNSLFNSLHIYLFLVKPNTAQIHNLSAHFNKHLIKDK